MTQRDLVNRRCLDLKLELLEQQRENSHREVDELVNNIMSLAEKWKENQEERPEIYELLQTIDRVVDLLDLRREDLLETDKKIFSGLTESVKQMNVEGKCTQNLSQEAGICSAFEAFRSETSKRFQKLEKKLNRNDEQMEIIYANMKEVKNVEAAIQDMKKQLTVRSENQNKLQDRSVSRLTESMEDRLTDIHNKTEFLKDLVMTATDNNASSIENVSGRTNSLEKVATDLSAKINRSEESIETILTEQEKCAAEIDELAKKLDEKRDGQLKDVQKQFQKANENYKMVCQMLVTKLKPLEQLHQILNKRCQTRDENVAKLQELVQEVAILSPRIDKLEMQPSNKVVGFTAGVSNVQMITINSVVSLYSAVYCNAGGHFNPHSGIFTAPYDGIYVTSITMMCQDYTDVLEVNIICGDVLNFYETTKTACWAVSGPDAARYCDLGLIELKTGDVLFAKVIDQSCNTRTDKSIRFSCFKIG